MTIKRRADDALAKELDDLEEECSNSTGDDLHHEQH
jgi:hypothetical protein